jgi:hypothetical protein
VKSTNCKKSHVGHCIHTAGSANVEVQNIFHMQNNITCSTNCKYRTVVTLYTLETWFQVYNCKYCAKGDNRDDGGGGGDDDDDDGGDDDVKM